MALTDHFKRLDDLGGQNQGQIRTQRSRLPPSEAVCMYNGVDHSLDVQIKFTILVF